MRRFVERAPELGVSKWVDSPVGTLYLNLDENAVDHSVVRHFDGAVPPDLVPAYVDLVRALDAWVRSRPDLDRLVRIELPTEVGLDYVVRPHHVYWTSTASYHEPNPVKRPRELKWMRGAVRDAVEHADGPRDAIIARVVKRSLLEPTYKTYFAEHLEKFVVVDPRTEPDDVFEWAAIAQQRR